MSSPVILDGGLVLERTFKGQFVLMVGAADGDPLARQVLGLVNGFTPLSQIMGLLDQLVMPVECLHGLLSNGLVRVTTPASRRPSLPVHWHADDDSDSICAL